MKRRSLVVAAALALLTTTTAHAASQMYPFFKGKYWLTYGMSSNSDGVPMCGMQTTGSDRLFYIKWTPTNGMLVQAWKLSWHLPPKGTDVPFKVEFVDNENSDNNRTITAEGAFGVQSDVGKGSSVFMTIADDDMRELLRVFGEADRMTLHFPGGDEPSWDAKMEGSRKAAAEFAQCVNMIKEVRSSQTQPVRPKATQPVKPTTPEATSPVKKNGKSVSDGSV